MRNCGFHIPIHKIMTSLLICFKYYWPRIMLFILVVSIKNVKMEKICSLFKINKECWVNLYDFFPFLQNFQWNLIGDDQLRLVNFTQNQVAVLSQIPLTGGNADHKAVWNLGEMLLYITAKANKLLVCMVRV